MKKWKLSGLLTMGISLLISLVSGYCTVVGMGKIFASAALMTMGIATVIEIGRVILLYDLHHFWDKLKWSQRIPGICMLLIAMTLSAMGVYGFFANAHSQRTQEVIPIEMEIKQKESEIQILNNAIAVNNEQLKQFDGKAFNKYTEMGYVTKAVNLQKEQQKITNKLYDDNRQKQQQITNLNKEILELQLDAEKKAPSLAHLKYYAKLFNVDDETAIIIFIVMIMTVFDTLAMYLMVTADWIMKIEVVAKKEEEVKEVKEITYNIETVDESMLEKIRQLFNEYKSEPIIEDNSESIEELKSLIKNLNLQPDLSPLMEKVDTIKNTFNNKDLLKKLDEIDSKINRNIFEDNIDDVSKNDVLLDKMVTSIDDNEEVINTKEFQEMIKSNPEILKELKSLYNKVPTVMSKLNKFNK